jgi:hypothetical protein
MQASLRSMRKLSAPSPDDASHRRENHEALGRPFSGLILPKAMQSIVRRRLLTQAPQDERIEQL